MRAITRHDAPQRAHVRQAQERRENRHAHSKHTTGHAQTMALVVTASVVCLLASPCPKICSFFAARSVWKCFAPPAACNTEQPRGGGTMCIVGLYGATASTSRQGATHQKPRTHNLGSFASQFPQISRCCWGGPKAIHQDYPPRPCPPHTTTTNCNNTNPRHQATATATTTTTQHVALPPSPTPCPTTWPVAAPAPRERAPCQKAGGTFH